MGEVLMSKLKVYRTSLKRIEELSKLKEQEKKKAEDQKWHLEYDIYAPKIQALEDKRDKELNNITELANKTVENIQELIKSQGIVVKEVEAVYAMIDVHRNNLEKPFASDEMNLYMYSSKNAKGYYVTPSISIKVIICSREVVASNKYLAMYLYTVENDKPVNRYSLVIAYRSMFPMFNDVNRTDYINKIHTEGCQMGVLREGPDADDLVAWYRKKGLPQNLKDKITLHQKLEIAYEEAVQLYEDKEWKMGYLLWKKNYYETGYFKGTETDEYKAICQEINSL
jgi:hypothetical protein